MKKPRSRARFFLWTAFRPAQAAEIKLETFPYTRYGTVPGTTITADAVKQCCICSNDRESAI